MKYTVVWTPSAERHLTEIWVDAQDRGTVTSAANSIDKLLAQDPESLGESRNENVRIVFVPPLGVEFEVFCDDRIAYVLAVWMLQPGKPHS